MRGALLLSFAAVRRSVVVGAGPGIAHLVGPVLVVGPRVEVARDGGLAGAGALHAIQPVGVGVGAACRAAGGCRFALRAGRVVPPSVTRAHEKLLKIVSVSVRRSRSRRRNWFTGMSPVAYAGTQLSQPSRKVCGAQSVM